MRPAQLTPSGRHRDLNTPPTACTAWRHSSLWTSSLSNCIPRRRGEAQLALSGSHSGTSPCRGAPHDTFASASQFQRPGPCRAARRRCVMPAAHGQRNATNEQQDTPDAAPPKVASNAASSTDSDGMGPNPDATPPQRARFAVPGQLIILTVALLWGTNPPALRYLYASDGTTHLLSITASWLQGRGCVSDDCL